LGRTARTIADLRKRLPYCRASQDASMRSDPGIFAVDQAVIHPEFVRNQMIERDGRKGGDEIES
jgi:hypothetical protein